MCSLRPSVANMSPTGECRAADIRPTIRATRSGNESVPAHAIGHADDGPLSIHDLQAHGKSAVPLPGSPRGSCRGLAPQRVGSMEPNTTSGIELSRVEQTCDLTGSNAAIAVGGGRLVTSRSVSSRGRPKESDTRRINGRFQVGRSRTWSNKSRPCLVGLASLSEYRGEREHRESKPSDRYGWKCRRRMPRLWQGIS